jgi:hypothetical protein
MMYAEAPQPPVPAPQPPAAAAPGPSAPAGAAPTLQPPAGSGYRGRIRSISVGLVVFLSCLTLVLATTTWWLHDSLLDGDHFVALTAPLADDPAVQAALVEATTNQVSEALDLGPVGSFVVTGIAREVYSSDAFAALWEHGMAFVHTSLVAVLRGDSSLVQTSGGQVVLNLFPLLDQVFDRINALNIEIGGNTIKAPAITNPDDPDASRAELSAAVGHELRPTFGVIPVADSLKLETAQRYVTLFDALVVILFIVTGLLMALAVVLTRRRVRMVALLGLVSFAALLVARLIVSSVTDGLATTLASAGPGAVISGEAVKEVAASYREFARIILLIGLGAAVGATAAAWLLERRASAASGAASGTRAGAGGLGSLADGWFLALAGLTVALTTLLVVGLSMATLVLVAVAYAVWLVVVVRSRRRERAAATT